MAISFVNKSAFASGTAALTVGAVASVLADDLILLFVESANQAITTPTGYTQVTSSPVSTGTANSAGGVRLTVFYAFATGADTTTSVADSGDHTTAIKMAFRGVNKVTPFDATPTTGIKTPASTSSSFPTITTATGNALVVLASALDLDAASTTTTGTPTNANLTGLTEQHDQTVIDGFGGGLVIITGFKGTAGATGATTATVTSTVQVYLTAALRENASTGSLSATEVGLDTFSSSGTVGVKGSLSSSEVGSDAFSASGSILIQGSLNSTEDGLDAFSSTGTIGSAAISGDLSSTEAGNDALESSGLVLIYGSSSANEVGNDAFSANGSYQNIVPIISVGGISRSKILESAKRILDLLNKDTVKQTEQIKRVKNRLKKVKKPEDLEDLQPIVNAAIVEVQKQKKLADDIVQLNFVINELKIIKNQLNDEEEALLMLMA